MLLEKNSKNSMNRKCKKYWGFQENEYSGINMKYAKIEKKIMDSL